MTDQQHDGVVRLEENAMVSSYRSADCHRGQVLLAALIAAACCAAFAGYLESSPPAAPAAPSAPASRGWAATTTCSQDADVRPEVAGRVARRLAVEDGLVRQGEVLFEIDPRPFQARLDHARSELALARDAESVAALRAAVEQARRALAGQPARIRERG
jgi:multidrug efflux pump subunit AcrA (membrane-fusion protein)